MISSPRTLSIFTTIKVFIHSFHSLHHLTRARAREEGEEEHTRRNAKRTHPGGSKRPCARRQSVGAPWSNLIKYN